MSGLIPLSDIVFAVVVGLGSCEPSRVECADVVGHLAFEASYLRHKNVELLLSWEHTSDPRTQEDRGQELWLVKARVEFYTLRWGKQ